jgi:hypothetical protein
MNSNNAVDLLSLLPHLMYMAFFSAVHATE